MRCFFKKHNILKLDSKMKRLYFIYLILAFISSSASSVFIFMLNIATTCISNGGNFLSIVLLAIFVCERTITSALFVIKESTEEMIEQRENVFIEKIVSKILEVTRDRVIERDEENNQKIMETPKIIENCSRFIAGRMDMQKGVLKEIINIVILIASIMGMIILAFEKVNNLLIFIISLVFSFISIIIIRVISLKKSGEYHKGRMELENTLISRKNDLSNIVPDGKAHMNFIKENFIKIKVDLLNKDIKEHRKQNILNIIDAIMITLPLLINIIDLCVCTGINNITPEIFLNAVAFSTLCSGILSSLNSIITDIYKLCYQSKSYLCYENAFDDIMKVYDVWCQKEEKTYESNIMKLPRFSFSYRCNSDVNFKLQSDNEISLKRGELTLFKGKSGSGKSTLVNIFLGNIAIEENKQLCNLKKIIYKKDCAIGCNNILSEITFCDDILKVNRDRLINILKGLKLYDTFNVKAESIDMIRYLSTIYKGDLSTGLEQRVILARVLYNLEDADVVAFDEPIANIDRENSIKIVEFLKQYCNKEKQRFIIICTHQYSFIENFIDRTYNVEEVTPKLSKVKLS